MSKHEFPEDCSLGIPEISTHCGNIETGRCVQLTQHNQCIIIPIKNLHVLIRELSEITNKYWLCKTCKKAFTHKCFVKSGENCKDYKEEKQ